MLRVAALATGIALCVGGVVVLVLGARVTFPLLASLPSFALTLGIALIVTSLSASRVMPPSIALMRDVGAESGPPLAGSLTLLLVILTVLALTRIPVVLAWWTDQGRFLQSVLPTGTDLLGLNAIPSIVALSLPVVTAATLVLFVLTSVLAIFAPSRLAFRVIAAALTLQAGYISGIILTNGEFHALASGLETVVQSEPETSQTLAAWLRRHDAAAGGTILWIVWLGIGYAFAAVVAYFSSITVRASQAGTVLMPATATQRSAPRPVPASTAAAEIDESTYSVHPRMTLVELWFTRSCTNYEIRNIPHTSRKWFSFSWTDGILRRQPAGLELVTVSPPSAPGVLSSRAYEVTDARTRLMLARLEPHGADWEIVDASGTALGRVLRESGRGFVKYRAFVGEHEVVRYKWTMDGLSTSSAQLDVEFLSSPLASLDPILALTIAPILEQRSRIASERSNP